MHLIRFYSTTCTRAITSTPYRSSDDLFVFILSLWVSLDYSSSGRSFTPIAIFETTRPPSSIVGGFSITTKFLLETALVGVPPAPLALVVPALDTVPHDPHRTLAAPRGYCSVSAHPAHCTYACGEFLECAFC